MLLGLGRLALLEREPAQAHQHLARGHGGIPAAPAAGQDEQRPVGLLGAVEFAALFGHLGQGLLYVHAVEQDRGGLLQVLGGQLGVLLGPRHGGNLQVQTRALTRLPPAILLQQTFQHRPRFGQSAGHAQAIGQRQAKDPLLGGEPRTPDGRINTNKKFPDMKALSGYVHGKGLKLGIYSSPGPLTCAGFTASYRFETQDAAQYAEWGIDYLKYDWCSAGRIYQDSDLQAAYQKMSQALARCGRPIVYSLCEYGMGDVWTWGPKVAANLWRTTGDIQDNWKSMADIPVTTPLSDRVSADLKTHNAVHILAARRQQQH